jgi:hypothetical protein
MRMDRQRQSPEQIIGKLREAGLELAKADTWQSLVAALSLGARPEASGPWL